VDRNRRRDRRQQSIATKGRIPDVMAKTFFRAREIRRPIFDFDYVRPPCSRHRIPRPRFVTEFSRYRRTGFVFRRSRRCFPYIRRSFVASSPRNRRRAYNNNFREHAFIIVILADAKWIRAILFQLERAVRRPLFILPLSIPYPRSCAIQNRPKRSKYSPKRCTRIYIYMRVYEL